MIHAQVVNARFIMQQVGVLFGWTPDYFNSCSNGDFGVPQNIAGFQNAHSGNAYAGIGVFEIGTNAREKIGIEITEQLQIGTKYFVSYYVSLADTTICYATNKIGALFSTVSYSLPSSYCQTNPYFTLIPSVNHAQVYAQEIITDKINWTKISGSFIADSAYDYIIIGNFFDDAHTSYIQVDSFCIHSAEAYYYVDDVCVTTDSIYNETWTGIRDTKNEQNEINIYPNPANSVLHISIENIGNYSLKVYNIIGELILQTGKLNSNTDIDLSSYSKGIYFLQIKTANKILNKKLIIN